MDFVFNNEACNQATTRHVRWVCLPSGTPDCEEAVFSAASTPPMLSARAARTALGGRFSRHLRTTAVVQADATDVGLLEKLLKAAKERDAADAAAAAAPAGDDDPTKKFQIQGFNAISNVGLDRFPKSQFLLTGSAGQVPAGVENEPHAVVLCRSWLDKATRPWPGRLAALAVW